MIQKKLVVAVFPTIASLIVAMPVLAQGRGRTDGPEGSEYGKGGYERVGGLSGKFSLQLDWGGATEQSTADYSTGGTPLFLGGTATYWMTDWFLVDASGGYIFQSKKGVALVGPRFRLPYYPLGFSLGLKAGALFIPNLGTRFAISPQAGADLLLADHLLLGLNYAPDIPIGGGGVDHRFFLSVGYRF